MNTALALNVRNFERRATRRPATQIAEKLYRRHLDFAAAPKNFPVALSVHYNRWRDVDLAIVAPWAAVALFWIGIFIGWAAAK